MNLQLSIILGNHPYVAFWVLRKPEDVECPPLAGGKGLKVTGRYVESALIWRLIMGPYDRITSSFYLPHALHGDATQLIHYCA
jgi:hypothetical protein